MKKVTLSLVALLLCLCIQAQHRSEQEAIQIAQEFFAKKQMNKAPRLSVVPQQKVSQQIQRKVASAKKAPAKHSSCYIINDEENNRFVIVAADERLNTILGYSDNGIFRYEYMPDALFDILYGYDREYDYLLVHNIVKSSKTMGVIQYEDISPMITSKWGQTYPFNADCPKNPRYETDSLCATGCIATSMAQLLNYYKKPTAGKGSYLYISDTHYLFSYMNYDSYQINWDNLVDDYNNATEEQKAEVAKLMKACGVSVAMDYGDSSGAYDYDIPYALINFFGYNPNMVFRNRDFYTKEEWDDIIMSDLREKRPILYGGHDENNSGGHSFIVDGCNQNGMYHLNFGQAVDFFGFLWSGIGDGFFYLDAILPTFLGEQWGDFSYNQSMICNISPNVVGQHEDTFYSRAYSLLSLGSSVYFQLIAQCYSSDANSHAYFGERFSGNIGIGLFDTDFNFLESLYEEPITSKSDSTYIQYLQSIQIDTTSLDNGVKYIIAPYVKSDYSEKPTRIRSHPISGYENNGDSIVVRDFYYIAMLENGKLNISEHPIIDDINVKETPKTYINNVWFNMRGYRIDGKPKQSGVYLHNGRKVVIKE